MSVSAVIPVPWLVIALLVGGIIGAIQVDLVVPLKEKCLFPVICLSYMATSAPYLFLSGEKTIFLWTLALTLSVMLLSHPLYHGSLRFHIYNFLMQHTVTLAIVMISVWLSLHCFQRSPIAFLMGICTLNGIWMWIMYYLHVHIFTLIPLTEFYYRRSVWHCVFAWQFLLVGIFFSDVLSDSTLIPILSACALVCVGFSLWGISDATPNMLMEKKMQNIESQNALLAQHVEDQIAFSNQLRRVRHDYSHQLNTLRQLLESGALDRAYGFISELQQVSKTNQSFTFCSNPIVNAVMADAAYKCSEHGIRFDYTIRLPAAISIHDTDLSSLLMNILNNAIEACERLEDKSSAFLDITIYIQQQYLVIKCVNSIDTIPEITNDRIKSSKPEADSAHGIGLESIHHTCRQYDGRVKLSAEDGTFSITAILCNQAVPEKMGRKTGMKD